DTGPNGARGAQGMTGNADTIPGLVAHYRGDGKDLSGNGIDMEVTGTVTLGVDRFGNPSSAAQYSGGVNFLRAENSHLPLGNAPRTASVWLMTTASFGNPGGSLFNYGLAQFNQRYGGNILSNKDYFVGYGNDLAGTKTLNDGVWHNIVYTF